MTVEVERIIYTRYAQSVSVSVAIADGTKTWKADTDIPFTPDDFIGEAVINLLKVLDQYAAAFVKKSTE
jgi:hypothetical protein